jgi:hypothetical protein
MRTFSRLGSLLFSGVLVLSTACGDSELHLHEEAYVDHDLGELTSGLTVGQAGGCDTSIVKALTVQLVDELNCIVPNTMVNFSGPHVKLSSAVQPYLAPAAATALKNATTQAGAVIGLSSAYRSVAQQYLLYKWWQAGQCGIQIAGVPGESNHQSGRAIDVPSYSTWISWLEAAGWKWYGNGDRVHFDFNGTRDLGGASVLAFQRLWNKNNPTETLVEDGVWGPVTASAMSRSPAEGFPVHGCQATGKLTGAIYQGNDTAKRVEGAVVTVGAMTQTTLANGMYEFTLPPGMHTVSVTKPGFSSHQLTREVRAGATTWGSMEINPVAALGTLKGKIYVFNSAEPSNTSQVISDATVEVGGKTLKSSATGLYEVQLPAGLHTVTVSKAGYSTNAVAREVKADAVIWGSVALTPSGSTDLQAPSVAITFPADGAVVELAQLELAGTVSDSQTAISEVSLQLNGAAAITIPVVQQRFAKDIKLAPGVNKLELIAVDDAGNRTLQTAQVNFKSGVTGTVHRSGEPESRIAEATVELFSPSNRERVASVKTDPVGGFTIDLLNVPTQLILRVTAQGFVTHEDLLSVGDDARLELYVPLNPGEPVYSGPPVIEFIDPLDGATVDLAAVTLNGRVRGLDVAQVRVGEVEARLVGDGRFIADISLAPGENQILVRAQATNGQSLERILKLHRTVESTLPGDSGDPAAQRRGGCASIPMPAMWLGLLGLSPFLRKRRRLERA